MGNAYDNASLIVTPNAYKASKIYALKPTDGSGDLSFSRAGSKMVRNSSGLWETIGTNIPPLHYPVGGGCPSWLFEAEATNVHLQSLAFNSYYSDNVVLTAGQTPTVLLGQTSTKLTDNAVNGNHRIFNVSGGSGICRASIYAKKDTLTQIALVETVAHASAAIFDLDLGTIISNPYLSATIEDAGNGWFRCSILFTASSSDVVQILTSKAGTTSYAGTGESLYIQQNQLETGTTATSPIITAGGAVTRLRDVPQIFTSINGLTNFSVFFDITPTLLNNTILFGSYSSGGTNSYLYYTSANSFLKRKDGTELNIGAHGMTLGTRYKIGYVVSGTTIKYFRNGALIFTSTIDGTLFDLASIWSSKDGGGSILPIRGICKDSILYQTALSDSEAIALTTI